MDRRVLIGGGIVAVAVVAVGVRMASNSGAKMGLDDALSHLPPGFTATHGPVTYNALTGAATVRDLVLSKDGGVLFSAGDVAVSGLGAQDATGTPVRVGEVVMHDASAGPYKHIARIDLTGLSPSVLRQVMDPGAYPGGKPAWTDKRMVLEHGEIHGLAGEQVSPQMVRGQTIDTAFSVGTVTMDGLRLAQLPAAPDYKADPLVLVAAIEQSMSQESSTLKDMQFSATGPSPVKGTIARGTSTHFDGGRLESMSIDGMQFTTTKPAGSFSVAGMSAHGFDMSKMLPLLPVIAADPKAPHPELLGAMHLDGGELHGLRVDYPEGPLVTMESISAAAGANGAPFAGSFAIRALTVKTTGRPLKEATRQQLTDFGMADFTTDLDEEGGFDAASGQLMIKHCDIDFHDLGVLHFTLNMTGIPQGAVITQPQIQAAMAQARLVAASVKWDDASLTGRVFKMAAAKQGLTPEQLRAGLAMPLASLPIFLPDQPDAAAQVNAFLDGHHSIGVTLTPPAPVSLAQLQDTPPQAKAALLGVRISGN
jgi:hypothetical protein